MEKELTELSSGKLLESSPTRKIVSYKFPIKVNVFIEKSLKLV